MELIDFILHVDEHLLEFITNYGIWIYAILFLIIFVETGLVVMPFLPGDSLLFAAGALAAGRRADDRAPARSGRRHDRPADRQLPRDGTSQADGGGARHGRLSRGGMGIRRPPSPRPAANPPPSVVASPSARLRPATASNRRFRSGVGREQP